MFSYDNFETYRYWLSPVIVYCDGEVFKHTVDRIFTFYVQADF